MFTDYLLPGPHVNIGDHLSSLKSDSPRKYRLKARAESQAETHRDLARAAYELHSSIGPARTTVSAIADRAGVQRLTVYRHFPDQESVFAACTAHAFELDPPPDPETWRQIKAPEIRLRTALQELYGYCRRNHQLLANLYRDAELPPVAAGLARRAAMLAHGATLLVEGWGNPALPPNRFVSVAVSHAMQFSTWQSLTQTGGLSDSEAIEAMVRFVRSVAGSAIDPA
jgi:AcrR family transcriptional regulator